METRADTGSRRVSRVSDDFGCWVCWALPDPWVQDFPILYFVNA